MSEDVADLFGMSQLKRQRDALDELIARTPPGPHHDRLLDLRLQVDEQLAVIDDLADNLKGSR